MGFLGKAGIYERQKTERDGEREKKEAIKELGLFSTENSILFIHMLASTSALPFFRYM